MAEAGAAVVQWQPNKGSGSSKNTSNNVGENISSGSGVDGDGGGNVGIGGSY